MHTIFVKKNKKKTNKKNKKQKKTKKTKKHCNIKIFYEISNQIKM